MARPVFRCVTDKARLSCRRKRITIAITRQATISRTFVTLINKFTANTVRPPSFRVCVTRLTNHYRHLQVTSFTLSLLSTHIGNVETYITDRVCLIGKCEIF